MSYDLSPARNGSKSTISNSKIRKKVNKVQGQGLDYTEIFDFCSIHWIVKKKSQKLKC